MAQTYHVLVIDNKTVHLSALVSLLNKTIPISRLTVETTREVTTAQVKDADLVILSGGTGRSIEKNPETFKKLIKLLIQENKPTIGICLGGEAVAFYFGAELVQLPIRRVGNIRINLHAELATIVGKTSIMVYEFHKWYINLLDHKDIKILATSKDGVEVFRHKSLPLWGLQFHPEINRKNNEGHKIFTHIVKQLGLKTLTNVSKESRMSEYAEHGTKTSKA